MSVKIAKVPGKCVRLQKCSKSSQLFDFGQQFHKMSDFLKINMQTCENVRRTSADFFNSQGAQVCKSCRSRREHSNESLVQASQSLPNISQQLLKTLDKRRTEFNT